MDRCGSCVYNLTTSYGNVPEEVVASIIDIAKGWMTIFQDYTVTAEKRRFARADLIKQFTEWDNSSNKKRFSPHLGRANICTAAFAAIVGCSVSVTRRLKIKIESGSTSPYKIDMRPYNKTAPLQEQYVAASFAHKMTIAE